MMRFHWKAALLAVCLVLGLAGQAAAADLYLEHHTKTVLDDIKVTSQTGFVKQADGDGIRVSYERILVWAGCGRLESDGKGKWTDGTISTYDHAGNRLRTVSFGAGQSCDDIATFTIDGPDKGYVDVRVRLKLRVQAWWDQWVTWHYRLEWGCCASRTAPVAPALLGAGAGRNAGDTPASLISAAVAGAVGRAR